MHYPTDGSEELVLPSVAPPPVSTCATRTTPRRGEIKNSRTKRERVDEDPAALRRPSRLDLDGIEGATASVGEDLLHVTKTMTRGRGRGPSRGGGAAVAAVAWARAWIVVSTTLGVDCCVLPLVLSPHYIGGLPPP